MIIAWQPCWPWPISVPVSELSKVLVPLWLSSALASLSLPPMWARSVLPPPRHGHSLGPSQRTNSCKALANPVSSKVLRVAGISCRKQRHRKHTANCMPSLAGSCTVLCKDLKDSVHPCLSCRHTAFIPFCDEGNPLSRGHFKLSQNLCLVSLFHYTKLFWLH